MRTRLLLTLVLGVLALVAPAPALAAGWSAVSLPRHTGFDTVSCTSPRWCLAFGGWGGQEQTGRWNGTRWTVANRAPRPKGAIVAAVRCRSTVSCVAVGQRFPRETKPIDPLVERWDGRRWIATIAPKPAPPPGYRAVNGRLNDVACPSAKLCFAVGQAVPFGAGGAPGVPLIERWNGKRWTLVRAPAAGSPLTPISCPTSRACTAVGGYEHETGTPAANNQQIAYPALVEHWDGRSWSAGSVSTPSGTMGALLGVSCTQAAGCLGVGSAFEPGPGGAPGNDVGNDQAIAAPGNGTAFTASTLAFPPSVYRSPMGSGPPTTILTAISCAAVTSCAAVGHYGATNGALGPLAATWNGTVWTQIALRRGPVQLTSVSCPSRRWCMAAGGGIVERWTS